MINVSLYSGGLRYSFPYLEDLSSKVYNLYKHNVIKNSIKVTDEEFLILRLKFNLLTNDDGPDHSYFLDNDIDYNDFRDQYTKFLNMIISLRTQ